MTLSPLNAPPTTVLVVDDHRKIRETLATILRRHGFEVLTAADTAAMRALLKHRRFDVILLDAMLPDGDGFAVCQELNALDDAAVIMVTACGAVDDRVRGLQLGADDYVVKPFEPDELVARMHCVVRRRLRGGARLASLPSSATVMCTGHRYRFAGLTFQPSDGRLVASANASTNASSNTDLDPNTPSNAGTHVQLSSVENRLLMAFLAHPHVVLSRDRLIDLCARPGSEPFSRAIDRQVSRLRQKLSSLTRNESLLCTVWGDGYRLAADVVQVAE